jgi:hypothetical protein
MKTYLTALVALLMVAASANAAILLGGFGGTSSTAIQSPSATDIAVTLTSPQVGGVPMDGFSQINNTLWGTAALDVAAPTIGGGDDLRRAVIQEGTVNPWTLVLQITNNGTLDIVLEQIHFRTKKDINNQGPNSGTLTYSSGDLSDTAGASTGFSIPNGAGNPFDITLSGFLNDTTLGAGESATFTWAHGAPEDPQGNTALRLDNFAISGTVSEIPEPATLAMGLLGLTMLAARRRS